MNEDATITFKRSRFRIGRVVWTIMWLFLLFLLGVMTGLITLLELPFRLVFGCLIHLWNLAPSLLLQWRALLLPLACLVIALPLAHYFLRWFADFHGRTAWRISHTVAIVALLFAGSAAAIAMSGITHQAAWIADVPWWSDRGRSDSIEAMVRIRNLQPAFAGFHSEHGRYPESLNELAGRISDFEHGTTMPSGLVGIPEPFIYLKPEPMASDGTPVPMLVSPLLRRGRVAVGFTDHSIRMLPAEQLEPILNRELKP